LRRRRLVLAPALLLAVAAALLAMTLPEHYRSSALVAALWDDANEAPTRQPEVAKRRAQQVRQRLTERLLVEQVLRETRPYTRASGALPSVDEQVQRLMADLRVRPLTPSSYVVEYVHRDAQKAALVPNRLVAALEAQGPEPSASQDPAARAPGVRFKLMGAAAIPPAPEVPNPLVFSLVGAVLGLTLGLGAALLAEHRDPTVRGPEDLERILAVPLLATLPELRVREPED
jgi:capsular polysaccharide biosynthesis protein